MPDRQGQDAGAEFEPVGVGGHHREGDDGLQTKLLADNTIAEPERVVAVGIPHVYQPSEDMRVLTLLAECSRRVADGDTHRDSFLINVDRPARVLAARVRTEETMHTSVASTNTHGCIMGHPWKGCAWTTDPLYDGCRDTSGEKCWHGLVRPTFKGLG